MVDSRKDPRNPNLFTPADSSKRTTPITPTRQPGDRGFTPYTPLQLLFGRGRDWNTLVKQEGILGALGQVAAHPIAAGVEAGAEAVSFMSGTSGLIGDMVKASPLGVGARNLRAGMNALFVGSEEGVQPTTTPGPAGQGEDTASEIAALNEKMNTPAAVFQLAQDARNAELPAHIQAQIDQLEKDATAQVEELNRQIDQKMAQLRYGQGMYQALVGEAERVGVIPPLDSEQGAVLNDALDSLEGTLNAEDLSSGLTPEVLKAITAVGDAQFASKDPDQAFNLLTHKIAFEQGLIVEIENLVAQRSTAEQNAIEIEEALRKEGTSDTFMLPIDVPTAEGMFTNVFGDFVADALGGVQLNAVQEQALAMQVTELAQQAAVAGGFEALALQLEGIAASYGIDYQVLHDAVSNGLEQGLAAAGLADQWRAQTVLNPGSPALAAGIQETVLGLGGTPEDANRLVNSNSLHQLVQLASGGVVGAEMGADMHGLGGLSTETYAAFGYDYETIAADAESQLAALVQYIYTRFGGDTAMALQAFRDGNWGQVN